MPAATRRPPPPPGARPFPTHPLGGGRPPGAVFFDRQAPVVRALCANALAPRPRPVDDLHRALDRLRARGTRVGVASHNRADDWARFDMDELTAMTLRLEQALGPIDLWSVCLIGSDGHCACTTAAGGALSTGADAVGMDPGECAVASPGSRLAQEAARTGAAELGPPADDPGAVAGSLARVLHELAGWLEAAGSR